MSPNKRLRGTCCTRPSHCPKATICPDKSRSIASSIARTRIRVRRDKARGRSHIDCHCPNSSRFPNKSGTLHKCPSCKTIACLAKHNTRNRCVFPDKLVRRRNIRPRDRKAFHTVWFETPRATLDVRHPWQKPNVCWRSRHNRRSIRIPDIGKEASPRLHTHRDRAWSRNPRAIMQP